ncbi:hypothetical protein [Paenibacillus lignilyticus]|uniref:B box-type domain-containing protein n=1 Tax=Paenibacillus lignilyticus TaxID=1172615 RepID=A0ABS5CDU9_9BACL|nr:hypothetical protein [Paenibacillus lignilyticus]MBP3964174.1 hypothetical protein [Paenibacillus lignilyticus]
MKIGKTRNMSNGYQMNDINTRIDCYFHPAVEAALACTGCGKHLCEACCDAEYPGFCFMCSLAVRNGNSSDQAHDQKFRVKRYILVKLLVAIISVTISTIVLGGILHVSSLLAVIWVVSLIIVAVLGAPASIGIDFMCKRIAVRWIRMIVNAFLHGLAGITLALLIFSSWDGVILTYGCINALVYYAVFIFFEKP